jgi:hypothetical protein
MSKEKSTQRDVAALIEERRQFEAWIEGLAQRRESTPSHVYERVHADYVARLGKVNDRLASHRGALDEELKSLQTRLALLDAEIQLKADERAEVDLRSAVGELSEGEVKKALKSLDDTLESMRGERSSLDTSVNRLQEFLAATDDRRDATATAPAVTSPVRASEPVAAETQAVAPAPAPPETPAPLTPARRSTPFDELGFLNAVIGAEPTAGEPAPASASRPASPPPAPAPDPDPIPPVEPVAATRISGVFRDEQVSESLLSGIRASEDDDATQPFAANVPANTPIKLRTSARQEPLKTLKCGECNTMNYATEWYCERCGAELAAL